MAKPKQDRARKPPKAASKKRTAEAAFSDLEDDDQDIFEASDHEANDNEAADQPTETAEEKRLRIGTA